MRPMRPTIALALAGAALAAGCGKQDGSGAPPQAVAVPPAAPRAREVAPEREVISEADQAEIAQQVLVRRDEPLAVGATAPRFDGYPEKSRAVIVFFRGEW